MNREGDMTRVIKLVIVFIALLYVTPASVLHAWEGDPWAPISRETILKIAGGMIGFSWSPLNTIHNWNYGDVWSTFSSDTLYYGIAYSEGEPQQNWVEFYSAINSTPGGDTRYGNDSGGFVSISWKLPKRYTARDFLCDAQDNPNPCGDHYVPSVDDHAHRLGPVGGGRKGLLPGDAFVSSNHILLFHSYPSDKSGIWAMEQTPEKAQYRKWTWEELKLYRPIRRHKINDYSYAFSTKWGTRGLRNGQFNGIGGVAVDASGSVYVTDQGNHRVEKFDSNGNFVTRWGSLGNLNGRLREPAGIAIDDAGYVYVADRMNHRIQKFDGNGNFVMKWGSYGTEAGQFRLPTSIAIDSLGNVYVAELGNSRIQKFDGNANFVTQWGSAGSEDAQFGAPLGIAVDFSGFVYVVDQTYHRVQKFGPEGNFIGKWGSWGIGDGQLSSPAGIAVDAYGYVYVADAENDRIQKFDGGGRFITQWGSTGSGDGQFQSPSSVAISSSGDVFVGDTANERLERFLAKPLFPAAPSNLIATPVTASRIDLSWKDHSRNEAGFRIKRKTGVEGTYSTIAKLGPNVIRYSDTSIPGSTLCFYTVCAYNDKGESAYSNEVVSYTVQLRMLGPNGGEVIASGTSYPIDWEVVGSEIFPLEYSLEYSVDGGTTWRLIAEGVTGPPYPWSVPKISQNKKNCLIRVKGYDADGIRRGMDRSDKAFTIEVIRLTAPNGGEDLVSMTTAPITWETRETLRPVQRVRLFYTKDSGTTWISIVSLNSNPGIYPWTVPLVPSEKKRCKIKVGFLDAKGVSIGSDVSDGYFTIRP